VLLLGGRGLHEFAVLRELGCRIVYLDTEVPLRCIPWVDLPIDVDMHDRDRVRSVAKQIHAEQPVAAILTHTEPHLSLMAYLAEELGLADRGLGSAAAGNCRDKWRTRSVLDAAGIPSPRAGMAPTVAGAEELASGLGFPVIIKPRGGAGGCNVRLCDDLGQVRQAASAILTEEPGPLSLPGLVVEEFVPGPEYAVQTLTCGGVTTVLTVFAQRVTEPPIFVELGYDYPPGLSGASLGELTELVAAALTALGVRNWIAHSQVRSGPDGFRIIEVNARRPGGRLVEMTEVLSGVDMIRAVSELALGRAVTVGAARAEHAAYRSLVFDRAGMLLYEPHPDLDALARPAPSIVEVEIPPGDPVLPVDDPGGGVYGRIVVFGDSGSTVAHDLEHIRRAINLQVLPLDRICPTSDIREFKPCC